MGVGGIAQRNLVERSIQVVVAGHRPLVALQLADGCRPAVQAIPGPVLLGQCQCIRRLRVVEVFRRGEIDRVESVAIFKQKYRPARILLDIKRIDFDHGEIFHRGQHAATLHLQRRIGLQPVAVGPVGKLHEHHHEAGDKPGENQQAEGDAEVAMQKDQQAHHGVLGLRFIQAAL